MTIGKAEMESGGIMPMMAVRFLLLLLALTLPFWALGALVQAEPLPGLPASALMAFMPAAAAAILCLRADGWAGVRRLFARAVDAGRIGQGPGWAALVLWMPALAAGMWLIQGRPEGAGPEAWVVLAMFAAFFLAALGEELGWTGYLLEPLARRRGELAAGLVIGVVWAAWHLIPFLQADRAWDWIAWQCVKTVAVRVVMVRLYFGAGRSVFAVALFHALSNVAAFALPMYGATYDPVVGAAATIALAAGLWLIPGRRPVRG
ncbi:MAG: CPBP family intramembrane glutamic endopeptidase [Pseudomonadota bacterium]